MELGDPTDFQQQPIQEIYKRVWWDIFRLNLDRILRPIPKNDTKVENKDVIQKNIYKTMAKCRKTFPKSTVSRY